MAVMDPDEWVTDLATWIELRSRGVSRSPERNVEGKTALLPSSNLVAPSQANNFVRSTSCEMCGTALSDTKELLRHIRTVHNSRYYLSECIRSYTRKDNYIRHLKTCNVKHDTGSFSCICGKIDGISDEHPVHIKHCRRERPGQSPLRGNGNTKQANTSRHARSLFPPSRRKEYPQTPALHLKQPGTFLKVALTISKDNTAGESERSARILATFGQAQKSFKYEPQLSNATIPTIPDGRPTASSILPGSQVPLLSSDFIKYTSFATKSPKGMVDFCSLSFADHFVKDSDHDFDFDVLDSFLRADSNDQAFRL